jgi:hypothetical protein
VSRSCHPKLDGGSVIKPSQLFPFFISNGGSDWGVGGSGCAGAMVTLPTLYEDKRPLVPPQAGRRFCHKAKPTFPILYLQWGLGLGCRGIGVRRSNGDTTNALSLTSLIYIKQLKNTSRWGARWANQDTRDALGDTDLRSNCSRARGLRPCGLFGL